MDKYQNWKEATMKPHKLKLINASKITGNSLGSTVTCSKYGTILLQKDSSLWGQNWEINYQNNSNTNNIPTTTVKRIQNHLNRCAKCNYSHSVYNFNILEYEYIKQNHTFFTHQNNNKAFSIRKQSTKSQQLEFTSREETAPLSECKL